MFNLTFNCNKEELMKEINLFKFIFKIIVDIFEEFK